MNEKAIAVFAHYELRTTDVDAAKAFYADVVGEDFWSARVSVGPLPARAAAMGAPPHWLGHIGPCKVEDVATRFVGFGASQLGPLQVGEEGSRVALLRDPAGAVVAVDSKGALPGPEAVAWHQLHTKGIGPAWAAYADLFGWREEASSDFGGAAGEHRAFGWDASGRAVGSMGNTALDPRIHTHWLFYFAVSDLEGALGRVRARGGLVAAGPVRVSEGGRVGVCDDGQGAAFGLYEGVA